MFFEQIKPGVECRHIPEPKSSMLFGVGFMDKSGWHRDQTDCVTEHYTLVYILNGEAEYETPDGNCRRLRAGDYFQRIPGVSHTTRIIPESHYFECFVVIGMRFYEAWKEAGLLPVAPVAGTAGLSLELAEAFSELRDNFRRGDPRENMKLILACQSLIVRFFSFRESGRRESAESVLIRDACRMLESDFTGKCNWTEFCRKHRCNYHSFRRRFKAALGLPPAQYRIRRRLDRAIAMLRERVYSISEIAAELGYSSPFEFSAQFKRCFGMAPSCFIASEPKYL